jgi:hypothetical protein
VIAWARRAGFYNIVGELQDALLLLPGKGSGRNRRIARKESNEIQLRKERIRLG